MEKLKMFYNKLEKTIQVLEPETYELFKDNPNFQIIDFTEGEFNGLTVEQFAKEITKKIK